MDKAKTPVIMNLNVCWNDLESWTKDGLWTLPLSEFQLCLEHKTRESLRNVVAITELQKMVIWLQFTEDDFYIL
jgi:hypothetical protein